MDEKQLLEAIRAIVKEENAGLATREEMFKQNNETRVLIENSFRRIQNLLEEDYGRLANAAAKTVDYDDVRSQVDEHRRALENHNQRLTELEKKVI